METKALKLGGLYRHYKGNLYRVHQIVRHSETLQELVMYETLYENPQGRFWVRPKEMFLETVTVGGKVMPRFELVEETKS